MKRFSRHMPPRPEPGMTVLAAIVLGLLAVLLVVWMVSHPVVAVVFGCVVVLGVVGTVEGRRRDRKLKEARAGESICTFARGFPRRTADPWILRATWDGIRAHVPGVPIRPDDTLERELHITGDDLDDLAAEVAGRCGRAWDRESVKRNPHQGGVKTVADLVTFMEHQPRRAEA